MKFPYGICTEIIRWIDLDVSGLIFVKKHCIAMCFWIVMDSIGALFPPSEGSGRTFESCQARQNAKAPSCDGAFFMAR